MQRLRTALPSGDLLAFMAGLLLGVAVIVGFGFVDIWRAGLSGSDFSGFWAGPRAVLDGVDPYDPARFTEVVQRYGTQETEPVYGYPPWGLVLFLPLALLPLGVAAAGWTLAGIAISIYGVGTLLRRDAPGLPAVHFAAGFALLASQPALITFYSGQWGFLLTGLLALSVRWLAEGRSARAGLAAIALVMKPQLFLFAAWALARAAIARGQGRFVTTAGVGGLALVAITWLAFPQWLSAFLTHIAPMRTSDPPRSVTLATPLVEILGGGGLWLALPIIAITLVVALRFDPASEAWLAVWLSASVALTSYGWSYDHIVLVVPIILAAGAARAFPQRATAIALLGAAGLVVEALFLYQLAAGRGSQSLNVLVPFTVFAIVAAGLWPLRTNARTMARAR